MKHVSEKRAEWLAAYKKIRLAQIPDQCARCGFRGVGWKDLGGDFEPHHPYRRRTRWACLIFIPLCTSCHREVEDNAKQARADGWIIDYKLKQ